MTDRIPLDALTSDQLDALYAEVDRLTAELADYDERAAQQQERAEQAEQLLRRYVELAAVTHKYPIQGGHDCLGEDLACAGCALAEQAEGLLNQQRAALDEPKEQPGA